MTIHIGIEKNIFLLVYERDNVGAFALSDDEETIKLFARYLDTWSSRMSDRGER